MDRIIGLHADLSAKLLARGVFSREDRFDSDGGGSTRGKGFDGTLRFGSAGLFNGEYLQGLVSGIAEDKLMRERDRLSRREKPEVELYFLKADGGAVPFRGILGLCGSMDPRESGQK
jgi:hypothetical protein